MAALIFSAIAPDQCKSFRGCLSTLILLEHNMRLLLKSDAEKTVRNLGSAERISIGMILGTQPAVSTQAMARRLARSLLLVALSLAVSPIVLAQTNPATKTIVIRAARLFEPESGQFLDHPVIMVSGDHIVSCLLYTSDAADERSSVDLGGRRIIK